MENGNGLELRLGLSFGGSSVKSLSKVDTSMDTNTEEVDDLRNFFTASQKEDSSSSKPHDNIFNNTPKSPVNADSYMKTFRGPWVATDTTPDKTEDEKRPESASKRKSFFEEINYQKKQQMNDARPANFPEKSKMSHISLTSESGSFAANEDIAESDDHQTGVIQPLKAGNLPVMFDHSTSQPQIELLETDSFSGYGSQFQQLCSAYAGRGSPNLDNRSDGFKISQAASPVVQNDRKRLEQARGDSKHHAVEEAGSSSLTVEERGSSRTHMAMEIFNNLAANDGSFDFSAIKPGMAADVKFWGSGSYPNLPWVSTTGGGPNGRTISGVTYRYSSCTDHIRIVCACHGSHMSLKEFVQHAAEDNADSECGSGLATFSSVNPAASTQS